MAYSELLTCKSCSEFQCFLKKTEANGIYVSDLPQNLSDEDAIRFFAQYGRVADLYLADSGSYCLVNFYDRQPVNMLLHWPVSLYGRNLRIRPRFPQKADNSKLSDQKFLDPKTICSLLSGENDFQSQVDEFMQAVQRDEGVTRKIHEVCCDLEKALIKIAPSYKILPFGSSVNNLALKDSDLDIFYGPESQDNRLVVRDLFRKTKLVLEKLKILESFRAIPNARVPILKFIHKPTGFHCDLSFKNTMGVQNSKLIKFLTTLDSRIKPFFMIVKYWAKLHSLTGKRLSNYALTLLLINFLQSLQDPILPPLSELQGGDTPPKLIGPWNAALNDDPTRLRPISNNLPIEELLGRFFESIVKTDFSNFVVCPFLGALIHRGTFNVTSRLPKMMRNYIQYLNAGGSSLKTYSALCIQDPLELNLNVTKNVSHQDFFCFMEHCEIAATLSHKLPPHLFLTHLLATSYDVPNINIEKTWLRNPMHVRPHRPCMTLHVPGPENEASVLLWRDELVQKISLIFKKVLKIHVENEKKGQDQKPGSDQDLICKGSQVLWMGRDKLWDKWSPIVEEVVIEEQIRNADEIQVAGVIENGFRNRGRKRRAEELQNDTGSKRQRTEPHAIGVNILDNSSEVDYILLDSEENAQNETHVRSIQDEIKLTNEMVKRGHASPAAEIIVDFTCKICLSNNGARIELSDRRSRNNYFSSLCLYLDDILPKLVLKNSDS